MRVPFVVGNWKMNGDRKSIAQLMAGLLAAPDLGVGMDVAVCPPYVYVPLVCSQTLGSAVAVGAQDVAQVPSGAYTGEVAAVMLVDSGCRYVIVGHSERRRWYGDSDDVVAAKVAAALGAGLTPILCVGEQLGERDAGRTLEVVAAQLEAVFKINPLAESRATVVAYEPVWAIGTGRTATPEQAEQVHAFVRAWLAERDADAAAAMRVLYGGSVTADNAATLFAMPNVDGGLIGGAALKADQFITICRAAQAQRRASA